MKRFLSKHLGRDLARTLRCRSWLRIYTGIAVLALSQLSDRHHAAAAVVGFDESFRGTGTETSFDGGVTGLDEPGWGIYCGFVHLVEPCPLTGGLTENGFTMNVASERQQVFLRQSSGSGGFRHKVQITAADMRISFVDPINGPAKGVGLTQLISDGDKKLDSFSSVVLNAPGLPDRETMAWTLQGRDPVNVPLVSDFQIGMDYDDDLRTITYWYSSAVTGKLSQGPFPVPNWPEIVLDSTSFAIGPSNGPTLAATLSHWSMMPITDVVGDFNGSEDLDIADIRWLTRMIERGDSDADLNADENVSQEDLAHWVHALRGTWFGDADLNGRFTSSDLVSVFLSGQYQDAIDRNASWGTGDWNGDGDFTTSDLVVAFQDGGYEAGPRAGAAEGLASTVPEPTTTWLLAAGFVSLALRRRNRPDSLRCGS